MEQFKTKRDGTKVKILETGQEFNSVQACADYLGVNVKWIHAILGKTDRHKVCRGYHIVRVDAPLPDYDLTKHDYRGRPGRRVRILETGEEFDSVAECANYINGSTGRICDVINGHYETYRGLHFIAID